MRKIGTELLNVLINGRKFLNRYVSLCFYSLASFITQILLGIITHRFFHFFALRFFTRIEKQRKRDVSINGSLCKRKYSQLPLQNLFTQFDRLAND